MQNIVLFKQELCNFGIPGANKLGFEVSQGFKYWKIQPGFSILEYSSVKKTQVRVQYSWISKDSSIKESGQGSVF